MVEESGRLDTTERLAASGKRLVRPRAASSSMYLAQLPTSTPVSWSGSSTCPTAHASYKESPPLASSFPAKYITSSRLSLCSEIRCRCVLLSGPPTEQRPTFNNDGRQKSPMMHQVQSRTVVPANSCHTQFLG